MKISVLAAVTMAGSLALMACNEQPVARVAVPTPNDQSAYRPMPMEKPLPPNGYVPGLPPEGMPGQPPPQGPGAQPGVQSGAAPSIRNEEAFVASYVNQRSPRIMVFVNRTAQGDAQSTNEDFDMIESSLVEYFDNSGKVQIKDSDEARAKLNREEVERIENGDPAANRLLASELQQDVLIRVTAAATNQSGQSSNGQALRLVAKAVSTTDARNLGSASVDMPFPISKTNVNLYTGYLASELMGQMAQKWSQAAEYDPIEVRIYKAASVDDSLKIEQWLQKTQGVSQVRLVGDTGGSTTSYATLAVGYAGGPENLYASLKDAIGQSQGIKAVDISNHTISLEVTGPMNLVTTTRRSDTTTTTETHTTEDQRIEPINPAPPRPPPPPPPPPPNEGRPNGFRGDSMSQ